MGYDHGTENRYRHGPDINGTPGKGCRCIRCGRAATRAVKWRRYKAAPGFTDATGTRRRLRALVVAGWSGAVLAELLGTGKRHAWRIMHGTVTRVTVTTATRVAELYSELRDQAPPSKQSVSRTRNYAAKHGWVGSWAWDDSPGGRHWIEDPKAKPARGWKRPEGEAA